MPFFGKMKSVLQFEYRDVDVEIFSAMMGATHCGLEHDYKAVKCEICQSAIRPISVYVAACNGEQLDHAYHRVPLARVKAAIEEFIDKLLNRRDDDTGDPPQDDDDDVLTPEGSTPIDGAPPKDGKKKDDDGEKAPPSLSDAIKGQDRGPADKIGKIAERIKKLGWSNKAKILIKEIMAKKKPTA